MNELVIYERKGGLYADSQNVAEWVGKRHDNLVRDIGRYCDDLAHLKIEDSTDNPALPSNLDAANFFVPGTYKDASGRKNRMYWLTRKGCEFVANKLTGRKGTLFTAAYITRYHQMEELLSARLECPAHTDAIQAVYLDPAVHYYTNEFNMINRLVLGVDAKHFREAHGIEGKSSIRPYLTDAEITLVNRLQSIDVGLVWAGLDYEARKKKLTEYRNRKAELALKAA